MMIPMFAPEPSFAETLEFTLPEMLTTEEEARRDEANLAAVREWLREGGN